MCEKNIPEGGEKSYVVQILSDNRHKQGGKLVSAK